MKEKELREKIAKRLAKLDGWKWGDLYKDVGRRDYLKRADSIIALLADNNFGQQEVRRDD